MKTRRRRNKKWSQKKFWWSFWHFTMRGQTKYEKKCAFVPHRMTHDDTMSSFMLFYNYIFSFMSANMTARHNCLMRETFKNNITLNMAVNLIWWHDNDFLYFFFLFVLLFSSSSFIVLLSLNDTKKKCTTQFQFDSLLFFCF